MKRFAAIFSAAVMLLLAGVCAGEEMQPASDEVLLPAGESPAYVTRLLETAAGEIGYQEGGNNYSKYGEWAGDPNAAWCAEFICWCVDQTGQSMDTELLGQVYPLYSGQNTGKEWFIARGRFVFRKGHCPDWGAQWEKGADHDLEKNEYIPKPGDLMFFSYNEAGDTEHVALVEYCTRDSMGNVHVYVIEGNNPDRVQRNSYLLDDSQILGFGLPVDRVDTTIRFGNQGEKVLMLQQSLNRIGLLDERHLTGVCGSNTRAAIADFQRSHMEGKTPNGIADRATQQALEEAVYEVEYYDPANWLVE